MQALFNHQRLTSTVRQRLGAYRSAHRKLLEKKTGSMEKLYFLPSIPKNQASKTTSWYKPPSNFDGDMHQKAKKAARIAAQLAEAQARFDADPENIKKKKQAAMRRRKRRTKVST
jgi:hypothetical protein